MLETTGHRPTEYNMDGQYEGYKKDDPKKARARARRSNPVASMAYRIAGGQRAYFRLPKSRRLDIRETARRMLALGADFSTAQQAEATERQGFVYIITHPRLKGVKVGRAYDPTNRVRGYQTGCPERAYRLAYAAYFEDCHAAELMIHARLADYRLQGEWFDLAPDEAQEAIEGYGRRLKSEAHNRAATDRPGSDRHGAESGGRNDSDRDVSSDV